MACIDDIQFQINCFCTRLFEQVKKHTNGAFKYCSAGGTKEIDHLTFTYGRTKQSSMFSLYAGLQCTSMALAAVIQHKIYSELTPSRINKILKEGNKLHTRLREDIGLSDHPDLKVAVEDFPYNNFLNVGKVFGRSTFVRLREMYKNVFTSEREDYEGFSTIREYIEDWYAKSGFQKIGFLLTIGESSYAVLLNTDGTAILFDSHGHLLYKGEVIKTKAGTIKFSTVAEMEEFLVQMYGVGRHTVIAPVFVSFARKNAQHEEKERKKGNIKKEIYQPYFTTAKDARQHLDVDEDKECVDSVEDGSPYLGMFAGGC